MNALDTALQHLAAAASALEHTSQPTLKDIKESRDKAKAAHEILDASTKLLGYGIYTVTQEPGADTPLFQPDGQPAAGVHTPEPDPEPKPLQTLGCIDVEVIPPHPLDLLKDEDGDPDFNAQDRAFDDMLLKLENAGIDEGLKMKAFKKVREAWMQVWSAACAADDEQAACREAYDLAVFALETRRPFSWAIPTEQEINDHARKQALVNPDPEFDAAVGE